VLALREQRFNRWLRGQLEALLQQGEAHERERIAAPFPAGQEDHR
jgi:hypothetical protein